MVRWLRAVSMFCVPLRAWDHILGHFGVQKTQVELQLHLGLKEHLWTSDLISLILPPYWVTVRINLDSE